MAFEAIGLGDVRTLRPRRQVLRQGSAAALAFLVPLFCVVYWLALSRGLALWVFLAQVLISTLGLAIAIGLYRRKIWVDHTLIRARTFFGRIISIPVSGIGSLVVVELFQSGGIDTLPHLFVLDSAGRPLLRMRGESWSRRSIDAVADELGVAVIRSPDPMTVADLGRQRPLLLNRLERRSAHLLN